MHTAHARGLQSTILTAAALTSIAVDPSYLRVAVGAADGVVRFFDLASAPACRCLQVSDGMGAREVGARREGCLKDRRSHLSS